MRSFKMFIIQCSLWGKQRQMPVEPSTGQWVSQGRARVGLALPLVTPRVWMPWLWVTVGAWGLYCSVCAWLASPLALWYEVGEMWHFRDLLWLYLPCVSEYQECLSALKSRSTWSLADLKVVWKAVFWGGSRSTLDGWRAACFLPFLPPSAFCTLFPGAAVCVCTHTSRTRLGPRVVGFSFVGSHCSYVFVCLLFKLGTTDLSSICTPSSPWKALQHAGRKAPVTAQGHTVAFPWGLRLICFELTPACVM